MVTGLGQNCFHEQWQQFVDGNSKKVFQTALLLSLNLRQAEDVLIAGVSEFDLTRRPGSDGLLLWERAVVNLSVAKPLRLSMNECGSLAWPQLQADLQPLGRLDRLPRISFVLRLFLGYTAETCAQLLGVKETEVPTLIAEAAVQLNNQSQNDVAIFNGSHAVFELPS